jgi:hypothetical protein
VAHKRGTTGSVRSKKARLKRASDLLHAAWDVLEPEDLSEARWGDLRNVITSVLAALRK